ncbi:phosphatidylethanolamine-binding protein [Niastella koreensis]|uniref:Phospholipid-binding protein, PBP family n=2 Tax=Niastella koreensis TaxID=354356 RepID=G8T869_NIAKG|nr:YbhB/YbcL family Raf kinase inhibitor-like protein [Niastella koreensis]AEV98020.1 phospholipid-binding protein, PBP family [Niastella koreensis GR20-10]OQP40181.1 phosphatidylethanolamine-binding protein [Niastella koreensis]
MAKTATRQLELSSPAFKADGDIPARYTCDGEGINPPMHIGNLPEDVHTLALIVEDPDAPGGTFDHWLVWNIQPVAVIHEHANPGISGNNSAGKTGYHPPCPPKGSHRYYFHVYALDRELDLEPGESKESLQKAMKSHILAEGTIMGRYERQGK